MIGVNIVEAERRRPELTGAVCSYFILLFLFHQSDADQRLFVDNQIVFNGHLHLVGRCIGRREIELLQGLFHLAAGRHLFDGAPQFGHNGTGRIFGCKQSPPGCRRQIVT